jgi:hypothetical protein
LLIHTTYFDLNFDYSSLRLRCATAKAKATRGQGDCQAESKPFFKDLMTVDEAYVEFVIDDLEF